MDSNNCEVANKKLPFKPLGIDQIVTQDVVEEIFAHFNPKIKVLKYDCEKGTNVGDNYLSLMYTIDVDTNNSQRSQRTYNIMFKTMPRNPARIEMIRPLKLFEREIVMYKDILTILDNKYKFTSFPKCLCANYNGRTDYIAMENVRKIGFKMLPRYQWLDLTHAKFVVQELAKFHSTSFKEWNGDGDLILSKFPLLKDSFWIEPGQSLEMNRMFTENTFIELTNFLEINKCNEDVRSRFALFSNEIGKRVIKAVQKTDKYPNVINHGDPWVNNLLFKYDDCTGNIVEMKFVDFQVAKVGSRIIDLSYLLFTSLQIPIMTNNIIMELLKFYYDTFLAEIKFNHNNSEINNTNLTWDSFMEEWDMHRIYGLTMALMFCPAMNAAPENIPDFETLSMDDFKGKTNKNDTKGDDEKNNFSNFMKSEHITSRILHLTNFI